MTAERKLTDMSRQLDAVQKALAFVSLSWSRLLVDVAVSVLYLLL